MHNLKIITPLGGDEPRIDHFSGFTMTERVDRALSSLSSRQAQEKTLNHAAASFLGFYLPEVEKYASSGVYSAFWMGPEQWMIDAPHESHELLTSMIKEAVGDSGSVVEQTDGWCRFDLDGSQCLGVFELMCNVDIRMMNAGDVKRTQLEHLGCFVLCYKAYSHFSVIGPRSSAKSIHHRVMTAAKSVI